MCGIISLFTKALCKFDLVLIDILTRETSFVTLREHRQSSRNSVVHFPSFFLSLFLKSLNLLNKPMFKTHFPDTNLKIEMNGITNNKLQLSLLLQTTPARCQDTSTVNVHQIEEYLYFTAVLTQADRREIIY